MGDDTAVSTVVLDAENGATLSKDVEKAYLDVLKQGTESYQADGTEIYMTPELNMIDKALKDIFGLSEGVQAAPELSELTDEDRQTLYDDTMKFFQKLYNETVQTSEEAAVENEDGTDPAEEAEVEE